MDIKSSFNSEFIYIFPGPGTPPRDPTYFSIFVTITLTLCWLSCPQDAPAASGPRRAPRERFLRTSSICAAVILRFASVSSSPLHHPSSIIHHPIVFGIPMSYRILSPILYPFLIRLPARALALRGSTAVRLVVQPIPTLPNLPPSSPPSSIIAERLAVTSPLHHP